MVKVSLTKIERGLYKSVVMALEEIGGQVVVPGDCVLIKPNLVEPAVAGSGTITDPSLIEAVASYCLERHAARVIIGEGPSYYQPESRLKECFTTTGVSELASWLRVEWVLFDEHNYRTFSGVSGSTPEKFRLTEFAFACNKFINLPVLKTHYLTKMTLAMKNLKGCLKREDKPGFHQLDLSRAVVEFAKIIRPAVNIIDATHLSQAGGGVLIASVDIVAADAVGCALMGIDPKEVPTVSLGAEAGLGEADLTRIDIRGEDIKRLKFEVSLPQEQLRKAFPLLEIVGADKACSGCLIPLLSALESLRERGVKPERPLAILLGNEVKPPENKAWLLVGDCARLDGDLGERRVEGCPLDREELLSGLIRAMAG